MPKRKIILICGAVGVAILIIAAVLVLRLSASRDVRELRGAVVRDDPDPRKQVPIAGVEIAAPDVTAAAVRSDSSGGFTLPLRPGIEPGRTLLLELRHPEYEPLKIYENAENAIYVLRMTPVARPAPPKPDGPETAVANVRIRYAMTSTTTVSIGGAVKTFEVINRGGVPCDHGSPCSPDGKWKAAIGSASLDAGPGNEFEDARLSCVAGPCPFSKVVDDRLSVPSRTIQVSVLNWSDTVSYLLEAQVVHTMSGDTVQQSYPVKFGNGMDFILPLQAQGPSIEAEVNGMDIVFPLGPKLSLPWATCSVKTNPDATKLYHCDLKPGYRFQ